MFGGEQCWGFIHAIKRATGIRIYVATRPDVIKGHRAGAVRCLDCHQKIAGQDSAIGAKKQDGEDTDNIATSEDSTVPDAEVSPSPDLGAEDDGFGPQREDSKEGQVRAEGNAGAAIQPTAPKAPGVSVPKPSASLVTY